MTRPGGRGDTFDPRKDLGRLRDDHPIALLPLRLETRFGRDAARGVPQLWVRVFPDECWVDTFDERLTAAERSSGVAYWTARWRAAGAESGRRAAWRVLVQAHGAGRAAWIVRTLRPVDPSAEPAGPDPAGLVLVVVAEAAPGATELPAVTAYWTAVWRAAGDPAAVAAADAGLVAAVGAARARRIVADLRPRDLDQPPPPGTTRATAGVRVAVLTLITEPVTGSDGDRDRSWSRAAVVRGLPGRLRLLAYRGDTLEIDALGEPIPDPLVVGPDPTAPPEAGIHLDADGRLVVPKPLRWLVDFGVAVTSGLGFRVDLTADQAQAGFDRLLVIGVRLDGDHRSGATALHTLLQHHRYGTTGLDVLPQGSPTNNAEGARSPYRRFDDADASFAAVHDDPPVPAADRDEQTDGARLAEILGLPADSMDRVPGAGGLDGRRSRAMSRLLWPATLGYLFDALLAVRDGPAVRRAIGRDVVERLRVFAGRHVSGAGPAPAIRVGRQPYGILPVTAWNRIGWLERPPASIDDEQAVFLRGLVGVLDVLRGDWLAMSAQAARVTPGAAAGAVVSALGLQSGSVRFHARHADRDDVRHNLFAFYSADLMRLHREELAAAADAAADRLRALGLADPGRPELLRHLFLGGTHILDGPVVDTLPPSETEPVRPVDQGGPNYLEWLRKAATSSLDELRRESGLDLDGRPLLFLLAKFAIERGYGAAAVDLLEGAGALAGRDAELARLEPSFIHVTPGRGDSESRWWHLYRPARRVTGDTRPLHEHLTARLRAGGAAPELRDAVRSLDQLVQAPTAALERAFADHVDVCGYRLDAWLTGLVDRQLAAMRRPVPGRPARPGIHLGAFGWLQDVRPKGQPGPAPTLSPEVAKTFDEPAAPALRRDPGNGGFVAAPSLDHAVTAAVLRAGYLSAADAATPGPLAVNLSSARVREALILLDGIRAGQSPGELLGYRLERGLHDRHDRPGLPAVITALRAAFPVRANRLTQTAVPAGTPVEAMGARAVVDGVRLLDSARRAGQPQWPYGATLSPAAPDLIAAVDAEVDRLRDLYDAVGDLALAESVHQMVQGNHERAAAAVDGLGGGLPPDPDVVTTPRSGVPLTHRVVLHLPADATGAGSPRAQAEPALDGWLATVLPPAGRIGCRVHALDPVTSAPVERTVTAADLGLRPIDLLHVLDAATDRTMTALDDGLVRSFLAATGIRPDARVRIAHTEPRTDVATFFATSALVRGLRALLLDARPLSGRDLVPPGGGTGGSPGVPRLDSGRLDEPLATLTAAGHAARGLADGIGATAPAEVPARVDGWYAEFLDIADTAARFGLTVAGAGQLLEQRRGLYARLVDQARAVAQAIADRLAAFDADLAAIDALPSSTPDDRRRAALTALERRVSTVATEPAGTVAALRAAVVAKRALLAARHAQYLAVTRTSAATVAGVLGQLRAVADATPTLREMTGESVDLDPLQQAVGTLADDLARQAGALADESARRVGKAEQHLAEAAGAGEDAVAAVQRAGQALFGSDFTMVPAVTVPAATADELRAALADADASLAHLRPGRDDPMGDWLHGLARVRDRLSHWESAVLLAEPLRRRVAAAPRPDLELTPAQLPHRPGASWLGLEIAGAGAPDGDHLLYTAANIAAIGPDQTLCGLVLDEWPERIPARGHTAGLAVHYDRPNAEPPQAWLVVTPATWDGTWQWDDLVDAVRGTLDLARIRAVEPDLVDASPYAPLLPGTVFPVYPSGISIMVDLAHNLPLFAEFREM